MVSAFAVSMLRLRLLALWDRLRAYMTPRASEPVTPLPDFIAIAPTLARDVSRRSVRFFTLCETRGQRDALRVVRGSPQSRTLGLTTGVSFPDATFSSGRSRGLSRSQSA